MSKYLSALLILFCACGSSPKTGENHVPDTAFVLSKQSTNRETKRPVLAPVGNTEVRGGPADVTIKFKEQVSGSFNLVCIYKNQNLRIDSAAVQDNTIHFRNPEGYRQGIYYAVLSDNKFVQFILGEDQHFSITTSMSDPLGSTSVTGSQENQLLYDVWNYDEKYEEEIAPFNAIVRVQDRNSVAYEEAKKRLEQIVGQRDAYLAKIFEAHPGLLFSKFKQAGQNPKFREDLPEERKIPAYRQEYWDKVDFSDLRLLFTSVIQNKLNNYFSQLTVQRPDSIKSAADHLLNRVLDHPVYYEYFANWIALQYEPTKSTLMDSEAVFVHMVQNYFTNNRAFWSDSAEVYSLQLRAYEMSKSLIGQKGPNVSAKDQQGQVQSIYDKRSDYLVVYLFNPTCEHCIIETPKLVNLYNQQKASGLLDVYSIAIDTDEVEWKNYLQKNNVTFTSVFDPTNESIYATYYVDITPEVYVLNEDRTIIAKNIKVDQVVQVIEQDRKR